MNRMRELIAELESRKAKIHEMGGERRVARQRERGKMTARERIDVLADEGSFLEMGIHGSEYKDKLIPADGVICGVGQIDGRWCAITAYDFTVMGGSIGMVGETKVTRMRELALRERMPMVWLVDSAGARIDPRPGSVDKIPLFADSGYLFREQVIMSGVVPQIAAMVGPGAAGTAYIPGLADFVPMVKGTSSMALGGPPLVKAAVGEDVTEEELGGSRVHNRESGVADMECKSDQDCLDAVRKYLAYFPSSCHQKPTPITDAPGRARLGDEILDVLPEKTTSSYDMKKIIEHIVDYADFFEIKKSYAKSMVTGLARLGGRSVGIVANNPRYLGGVIDSPAAEKAARFVNLCDAFNIPLIFLVDVPGFLIGSAAERSGIIQHGSRMLYAVARATVPKLTVVIRKAYGAGYYVMCGRAYEPDLFVSWPTGEISVMGPEGLVSIAMAKALAVAPNRDDMLKQLADHLRPHINIYNVAGHAYVDEVIDPRETRKVLIHALERTRNKTVERPWRKKGVVPV